jgi:O-antigen/teichoic acid export membrane protein
VSTGPDPADPSGPGGGPGAGPTGAAAAVGPAAEGVPAALSLAPVGPVPSLGGDLLVPPDGTPGPGSSESVGRGLLQAGPLALAGLVVNGANVIVTVLLARILTTRGYGHLAQLTGLFLIVSLPGTAVVVAVVRQVTAWRGTDQAHVVQRWARRLHRQGTVALVVFTAVVVAVGPALAAALGQHQPAAVDAMVVAGGVWILLSLDRGLLQAHQNYRDLAANIALEGGCRTVALLSLAAAFGVVGAAVGFLVAEVVTTVQARLRADRVWAAEVRAEEAAAEPLRAAWQADPGVAGVVRHWRGGLRRGAATGGDRRAILADLLAALVAMALLALLQNIDVIVFGRLSPHLVGSYAAVSVASKAIVFGALALGGYLLPEAAIRWHQGGHALRPLLVTFLLLGVPALGLVAVAICAPHLLFTLVFSARYLGAESAFAPLALAMVCLSVTVILTMYLLAIGWRWITGLLAVGAVAATAAVVAAQGAPRATARADLVVQAALVAVVGVAFVAVHRRRWRAR